MLSDVPHARRSSLPAVQGLVVILIPGCVQGLVVIPEQGLSVLPILESWQGLKLLPHPAGRVWA